MDDILIKIKELREISDTNKKEELESELIDLNYDSIIKAVNDFNYKEEYYSDLLQEAFMAYLSAIYTYDFDKKISFNEYFVSILNTKLKEITEEYDSYMDSSKKIVEILNSIIDKEKELEAKLNRVPLESEVAKELDITEEALHEYKEYAMKCSNLKGECSDSLFHLINMNKTIEEIDPETLESLKISLDLLDDRSRAILEDYYGIGTNKLDNEAICDKYLISSDRLVEVINNSLGLLKANMGVLHEE